jgi:hypothetical protein
MTGLWQFYSFLAWSTKIGLVGGASLGTMFAFHDDVLSNYNKSEETRLEIVSATAREIKFALATPVPQPERLGPINRTLLAAANRPLSPIMPVKVTVNLGGDALAWGNSPIVVVPPHEESRTAVTSYTSYRDRHAPQ